MAPTASTEVTVAAYLYGQSDNECHYHNYGTGSGKHDLEYHDHDSGNGTRLPSYLDHGSASGNDFQYHDHDSGARNDLQYARPRCRAPVTTSTTTPTVPDRHPGEYLTMVYAD